MKDDPATWSRERIQQEITEIQLEINSLRAEAAQIRSQADQEVASIRSGSHPRSNEDNPYKHTDTAYERAGNLEAQADRYQRDYIDPLKRRL